MEDNVIDEFTIDLRIKGTVEFTCPRCGKKNKIRVKIEPGYGIDLRCSNKGTCGGGNPNIILWTAVSGSYDGYVGPRYQSLAEVPVST